MNKILKYTLFALMAIVMAACGKEDPFDIGNDEGSLSIKKMIVKIENEQTVVRSSIDVASFLVDIMRGDEVVDTYVYAEMPEVITLPTGTYTVRVRSSVVAPMAWETPYFEGSAEFEVRSKEITEVETVVCKLANVRVSVIFDETLKAAMSDDSKVTVVMGDNAVAVFSKEETRSAYFAYLPGSTTLVATFTGSVGSNPREEFKAYADVKPGNHYKITYSTHNPELPDNQGEIVFSGLTVDAFVVEEDLTINIDPDDDIIEDNDRPQQGDDNPNPPQPPTPGTGPEVTIPADSDIVFDTVMPIVDGRTYKLLITSETGFTDFKVDIISPYLTDDFLAGVGLTTHLDLINPGPYAEALTGLGLPVNVGGTKSQTFDISMLVPLLDADPVSEVHEFRLSVSDASGTIVKSIKFKNN